jgi:peptide/nickel transport system substrate-binding protein
MLIPTDAETLDPRHATDAVALRATRLVHVGLFRLDPETLAPEPTGLVKDFTWTSPLDLTITLRDGVRFHSGAPFGAEDVVATLRAFASPEVGSRHARIIEPIASAVATGPLSLAIHLKRAHATLVTDLELPILRAAEAASPPRPDGSLDGLGPYVVARRAPGEIALEPAPAGTGVPPFATRAVVLRTVHDENARALRMHAGRADLVVNGFSPTLLPALASAPGLHVGGRPGANLTYLLVRTDRGPLADARVRRAIASAVELDEERIAKTLFAGRASAASTLLPPSHWAYTPAPAPSPGAPSSPALVRAAVRERLAEAGALPLRTTLLVSTDRLRGTIARTLAQDLEDAGVSVDVVPLELGTLIARLSAGDFELATLTMPELTEPNVLRVFLHSSSIPPAGANRGRVRDAEVDRLLDLGDETLAPDARRRIYAELEARVRDQALFIPLWHEDQVWVASERARGFRASAEGRWLGLASLR